MPIYFLKPRVAALEDAAWNNSRFRSECWVNAADEEEARGLATGKFLNGEATIPGDAPGPNPWKNPALVEASVCEHAPNNMQIPNGTVVASQQV
jgi:hypothetical protein